jgi:hypothetical protein
MIGCVVISKIFNVLKNKQEFDLVRYIAALNDLLSNRGLPKPLVQGVNKPVESTISLY